MIDEIRGRIMLQEVADYEKPTIKSEKAGAKSGERARFYYGGTEEKANNRRAA